MKKIVMMRILVKVATMPKQTNVLRGCRIVSFFTLATFIENS